MSQEAKNFWLAEPEHIRKMLESNVFCWRCKGEVTIREGYDVVQKGGVIALEGICSACGNKVARVLDGLEEKMPKKLKTKKVSSKAAVTRKADAKGKTALRYFVFNVWLYGDYPPTKENRIIRKIQIAETKSLYNFAKIITQAFDFYFDHCFGFYSDLEKYHESENAYELFYDLDEVEPPAPHVKGVKRTKLQQAFKKQGDTMLFLFDYGDGWHFFVELEEIKQAEKWDLKPVILESIGKAPEQYPPCEDEWDGEE